MTQLAACIDGRRWGDLSDLLHPQFRCRYLHTGESFDRDAWVRLNAEYPGFQHFVLEDCIGEGDRAAGRAHVTGESGGQLQHFAVATFITALEGVISEMTEVWTDVDKEPPRDARPL